MRLARLIHAHPDAGSTTDGEARVGYTAM